MPEFTQFARFKGRISANAVSLRRPEPGAYLFPSCAGSAQHGFGHIAGARKHVHGLDNFLPDNLHVYTHLSVPTATSTYSVCRSDVSDFFAIPWTVAIRLLCPWDFPSKNTGVGCHSRLQAIFLTQRLNPGLLRCRQILYRLSHQGNPSTHRDQSIQEVKPEAHILGSSSRGRG